MFHASLHLRHQAQSHGCFSDAESGNGRRNPCSSTCARRRSRLRRGSLKPASPTAKSSSHAFVWLLSNPDGLREVIRTVMQEVLEAEMDEALGAAKG
ncbi:transposase, partial [Sinorhizobium meliloti]|uniref:transposase n=1 Tax=Rhizobium meliloti TaxID=382 RepID=UPI001F1CF769